MVLQNPPSRLVKHIIRSYARLADNTRVRSVMRENIPDIIRDKTFYQTLDESSKRWLQKLLKLLGNNTINTKPRVIINPEINFNEAYDKQIYGTNFKQNFLNNYNDFIFKNGK